MELEILNYFLGILTKEIFRDPLEEINLFEIEGKSKNGFRYLCYWLCSTVIQVDKLD